MRAVVVVDLGFGDAGKGLVTDFLVRRTGAQAVVRFNGGAQAGHNVVAPDGRHHTFAQFGAGTFVPGVATRLSRHFLLHPTALLVEARALGDRGVHDTLGRLGVSARARVVTPYHQAVNRLRELARGDHRHGSCGAGVGETAADAVRCPEGALCAGDLGDAGVLRRKLGRARERLRSEVESLELPRSAQASLELRVFERADAVEAWIDAAGALAATGAVVPDERLLAGLGCAIFEGAQGVLLDERHGFHPYTTWSSCTFQNALELLDGHAPGSEIVRLGVLRAHAVRHGPGPLPTEDPALAGSIAELHNRDNPWQGQVRHGWFDAVLARHALACAGGAEAIALTHLDAPLPAFRLATSYRTPAGEAARSLPPLEGEALTGWLGRARPLYETVADPVAAIEGALGLPVAFGAHGPRAADVRECRPTALPAWLRGG
ncbi:MAG: adenylosuccinate synthetase [Myxococcales bacterium]